MIKVLYKVDAILRLVADQESVPFTEIQRELGIHKATLSHILKTLCELGYIERTVEGNVVIGSGLVSLVRARLARESLEALAQSVAQGLAETTRETVTIGQLRNGERYNLAKAVTKQTVSVDAQLEIRPSPFDTATGRVLLAFSDSSEVDTVLAKKGLPGSKWAEVTDEESLQNELARIRDQGYAELIAANGEAQAIARPVLYPDGSIAAAIGLAIPSYRLEGEQGEKVRKALETAVTRMEAGLL